MMRDPYEPYGGLPLGDTAGFTAQDLDDRTPAEQRADAIAACQLCDTDGYRTGGTRCDHIDHAAIAERHRAAVRAELDRIARRKETPTTDPERSAPCE
ncbi:MAG: hypothetical protein K2Y33_03285 [Mycolicibacterium frederiksbergense]|nr:hypothetical protein [Mycolicibacterium frederiksbergense]